MNGETLSRTCKADARLTAAGRIFLWTGVLRRLFLFCFRKKYIEASIETRTGECLRCGACCRLAFAKCMYLDFDCDGKASCSRHTSVRMPNCVVFPIDSQDIKERDLVAHSPCGFYFRK
ncbi:MAG: hypothetical protein LBC67_05175 [Spirochaetales bacterium]|nr:hypothetical protein [Spirochaetales bacterium]